MASIQLDDTSALVPDDKGTTKDVIVTEIEQDSTSSSTPAVNEVDDDWIYPHPTDFKLTEAPIDEVRELSVGIIGAGLSGITAGILLPAKVPGVKLTIIDKNADVGGTWLENIYPGVRCDIPAHVYQSTFSPNTAWSEEYAQGAEIRNYWQSVARKYDVYSKVRFNTRVLGCYWEPVRAQWRLEIEDVHTKERSEVYFDYLITAIGHFNEWKLPNYPGMEKYQGVVMHSSGWDPDFNVAGKRIATIGNGASGIQVTTEVRKTAAHVDHYARSRTWIAGSFNPASTERQDVPLYFSEVQKAEFKDPERYLKWRKSLEDTFWRAFAHQIVDSESSRNTRDKFTQLMQRRLGNDLDLLDKLVPDFPPHCRRLTPGPGYLEALTQPNLELIQTPIKEFTEDGITTIDGVHRPVEAVICSTGANTDFAPPFPIVAGDYDLHRDWKPDGAFGFPRTYLGISMPHFPNLSFVLGPNAAGASGTVPHAVETQITYIAKVLRKISSQGIRTITPSKEATDDFITYCDAFFPRTNLARKCSSWSNGNRPGARIHGHWPGSAAHLAHVRREPRWEDFEYTYVRPENRFAYFGNGWTRKEVEVGSDMTGYLRVEGENDLRDLHERWWDL